MTLPGDAIEDLVARVRSGLLTARELVEGALERIAAADGDLGAFVAVDEAQALAQADAVDRRRRGGERLGPLAGIPVGVKDLEDAAGLTTTHGSLLHLDDPPARTDSILVARLRAAGAVVVGKTNTPERGWTADTVNLAFGPTRNPWSADRSAGGSSGGSAVAVAAGLVPLATGSDGGGSIRIPSALCGITGLKPTQGRIPEGGGTPPEWPALSTPGPMAASARDLAYVLDVVVGPDQRDPRSLPHLRTSWRRALDRPRRPRRVLWCPSPDGGPVDREVRDRCETALRQLASTGAVVEVVERPWIFEEDPLPPFVRLTSAYHLRTHRHLLGDERWELVDPSLRAIVERAAATLDPLAVVEAHDAAHRLAATLAEALAAADLLVTPVTAGQAPEVGGRGTIDGEPTANWIRFTVPSNLVGGPAGTVWSGERTADGVPVGLQVVGPRLADREVLEALAVFEEVLGATRAPGT